ncbi:metalloendopeptidase [Equine molluscum contagiosum-like virus]|nr:metalloendopeptidase [Equine molluscum contagiosum-like virus]
MILLSNGVRVFLYPGMAKDIYIGLSNFGFEHDLDEMLGVAHLLEHILIAFDYTRFAANASTARTYMSFWCRALRPEDYLAAVQTAVSWFFRRGVLRTDFSRVRIRNYIRELENEYYFRQEVLHCMDVLTFLGGGDLYNGGRLTLLEQADAVRALLAKRMRRLSGPNVVIFVRAMSDEVLALLEQSFGTLPRVPSTIPPTRVGDIHNKIVLMPAPFYAIMVRVDNTMENILAMLCLGEAYHFVDYETFGDRLYVTLSFVHEHDYEHFLRHLQDVRFEVEPRVELNYSDDYVMTLYVNFPWMQHDLCDYLYALNADCPALLRGLEANIRRSVQQRQVVVIYPSFSPSMYNTQDRQQHRLLVLDVNFQRAPARGAPARAFRRQPRSEVFVRYDDPALLEYAALALLRGARGARGLALRRLPDGLALAHQFSHADLHDIMASETFIKFSRSRPAVLFQYIFLAYFATGKSIADILEQREALVAFSAARHANKLVFARRARYGVVTRSSFVCGVLRGPRLDERALTESLWELKRRGLLYSLEFTRLHARNTFYVFAFSIYPEQVARFFASSPRVSKHCFVVSTRGEREDYSALRKEVVIHFV